MDFNEYLSIYSKKDHEKFLGYLAEKELEEWKALYKDDNSLTKENIKKFFDKGTQLWNTYSDDDSAELVDQNGAGCEDVRFGDVNWALTIKKTQENGEFEYNIHQYGDYACIFLYLLVDHVAVDCPFLSSCAEEHLIEDLNDGKYSKEYIDEALKSSLANKTHAFDVETVYVFDA